MYKTFMEQSREVKVGHAEDYVFVFNGGNSH